MYHQIHHPNDPRRLHRFEQHLKALKAWAPIVLPGEDAPTPGLQLCLTFDDAYYDFYAKIWPLLQHYKIPAVLGVPIGFIQEHPTRSTEERLATPYPSGLANPTPTDALCTLEELRQMHQEGLHIACHGYWHKAINAQLSPETFLLETVGAQQKLNQALNTQIESFVFPFGTFAPQWLTSLHQNFKYLLRIGHALNQKWEQPLLHRIDADHYWLKGTLPSKIDLITWWLQGHWKRYRKR